MLLGEPTPLASADRVPSQAHVSFAFASHSHVCVSLNPPCFEETPQGSQPSNVCRWFLAGNCRFGKECRFVVPDSLFVRL